MENKEVFVVTVLLATIFAVLSILSDATITGTTVGALNKNLSFTFSVITIVLVAIILLALVIELWKVKYKE